MFFQYGLQGLLSIGPEHLGRSINSFSDWAKGPERMDEDGNTASAGRCGNSFNPSDHWGMVGSLTGLGVESAVGGALRSGRLGMIGRCRQLGQAAAVPTPYSYGWRSQQGQLLLLNGGSQGVTYDTAKNTWTQSLITDGWATLHGCLQRGRCVHDCWRQHGQSKDQGRHRHVAAVRCNG